MEETNNLPATQEQVINDLNDLIIPMPLAVNANGELIREYRVKLQTFMAALNQEPPPQAIGATPDGNASTILISHIEMTLDEMFFGLWDSVDFRYQQIANEVVGSILLVVTHPVTGKEVKRTGAAAIQIMVDATPEELKYDPKDSKQEQARKKRERNKWALDVENKKPGALDMSFPKLKAECLKNAAQSMGKLFGRDLNRGDKADQFRGILKTNNNQAAANKSEAVVNHTKEQIKKASTFQRAGAKTI